MARRSTMDRLMDGDMEGFDEEAQRILDGGDVNEVDGAEATK